MTAPTPSLASLDRGFRHRYLRYDDLTTQLRAWAEAFPALVRLRSLGRTLAVVSNSAPTKGIALPFISYGSTSLVVGLAAAGVLVSVSRSASPEAEIRVALTPEAAAGGPA